ncbi:MAG: Lrp/AsnC family transcriptional regulator [Rhodospirillales bacterium]|nr:Lrp/AsnC family transcriptional regulator [Rhodospirillales bacterium]
MDPIDRAIINTLQEGFPITERPYQTAADAIGIEEGELIQRLERMLEAKTLSRFGPLYDTEKLGGAVTLAAMAVPDERFDEIAEIVNAFPEVAHNYERGHRLNMWFVVAAPEPGRIAEVIAEIEDRTGFDVLDLPKTEEFFLQMKFAL